MTYAEFGVYCGSTAIEVAKLIPSFATMLLFDYAGERIDQACNSIQRIRPDLKVQKFVSDPTKALDSYAWHLGKIMHRYTIDYAFFDGAHTWAIDGFSLLLVERMLADNAIVEFDDYDWTLRGSPTLSPDRFPQIRSLYTDGQIGDKQVKRIINTLVRRNPRYTEIEQNRVFAWDAADPPTR